MRQPYLGGLLASEDTRSNFDKGEYTSSETTKGGGDLERRGIADIQSGASNLGEDIHYAEEVHGKLAKERKGRERYGVHVHESVWIVGSKGDD